MPTNLHCGVLDAAGSSSNSRRQIRSIVEFFRFSKKVEPDPELEPEQERKPLPPLHKGEELEPRSLAPADLIAAPDIPLQGYVKELINNSQMPEVELDTLLLPFWRVCYVYDNIRILALLCTRFARTDPPTDGECKLTVVCSDVCANGPGPQLDPQFLTLQQPSDPMHFLHSISGLLDQTPLTVDMPRLSTDPLNPTSYGTFGGRHWRIMPFKFGPPVDGLGKNSKMRLLRRLAWPFYKYSGFLYRTRHINEAGLIITPMEDTACYTSESIDSSAFDSVPLEGYKAWPGPVDVVNGRIRPSAVPSSAFAFSKRDRLDWSSSIIQTSVISLETLGRLGMVHVTNEINALTKKKAEERLARQAALKARQEEFAAVKAAQAKAAAEARVQQQAQRETKLLEERERATEEASTNLKRDQAIREKARAALLARQRKTQQELQGNSPPQAEQPSATASIPTSHTPPFVLRDPKGLYADLGLSTTDFQSIPSDEVIRNARIEQLQVWHPDRNRDRNPNHKQDVKERAQLINAAYDRLETDELRTAYQAQT